jgi:hypothetical protein
MQEGAQSMASILHETKTSVGGRYGTYRRVWGGKQAPAIPLCPGQRALRFPSLLNPLLCSIHALLRMLHCCLVLALCCLRCRSTCRHKLLHPAHLVAHAGSEASTSSTACMQGAGEGMCMRNTRWQHIYRADESISHMQ